MVLEVKILKESVSSSVVSGDPTDCTVCGLYILQARTLEWVAFPFSRGSSQPRSLALQVDSLPAEPQGKLDYDLTGLSSRGSLSCVAFGRSRFLFSRL